jgi:hypothetical protein
MLKKTIIIAAGILLGAVIAVAGKPLRPAYMHFDKSGSFSIGCGEKHASHALDYLIGTCG